MENMTYEHKDSLGGVFKERLMEVVVGDSKIT